jgi:hypothetical protein
MSTPTYGTELVGGDTVRSFLFVLSVTPLDKFTKKSNHPQGAFTAKGWWYDDDRFAWTQKLV